MIRITGIYLPISYDDNTIRKKVCSELRIQERAIKNISLFRRSIDARKKNDIHFTATVDVQLTGDDNNVLSRAKNKKAAIAKPYEYTIPPHRKLSSRPVIVGFGPAGMFAGLILAAAGEKPIIIERGKDCDSRVRDIDSFIDSGILNKESNIQFGEGGAGTFSDGKLNTGTKDSRARKVLIELVEHGAPEEILYNAKPHIGTDNLRYVIKNIRKHIIEQGGEVRFNTKLTSFTEKNGRVTSVTVRSGEKEEIIETDNVILAIGHSSRDTLEMLYNKSVFLEQKPFSVGARIEHFRTDIDRAQFGGFAENERLGAAPYKMNVRTKNGRGAYTFCMCPGGVVVPASSEKDSVVTNGMSEFNRDAVNSNSALLVGVTPEDFGSAHPLAGIEFQRDIEKAAYKFGGGDYIAPVQKVGDFLNDKLSTSFGAISPSYARGTQFARTDDILPEYVCDSMREAIAEMDKHLSGFANPDALLTSAETRSSSPVRITRNIESLESVSVKGLYPCGEGAGYAGGIVSAAVDGIKCAEKVLINNS